MSDYEKTKQEWEEAKKLLKESWRSLLDAIKGKKTNDDEVPGE